MAEERVLYSGRFLHLKCCDDWEYVERANARCAVVIVALTNAGELLLVEQPRAPMRAPVLELPAGLVGDIAGGEDEDLAVAAARELEEETGYRAARLEPLTAGPPTAGLTNEMIHVYRARDLVQVSDGGGDDSERITPHAIPLADVPGWLEARRAEGVYVDPKIYAGLYFLSPAWE